MRQGLALFAAALWWGSLSAIGFLAVPLLFQHLATPAMAGGMAAKLFAAQTWLSLACGLLLLMHVRSSARHELLGWTLAGLVLALLLEFAVVPRIVARENLMLWHGLGSAFYFAQWVCAGVALLKAATPAPPAQATGDR